MFFFVFVFMFFISVFCFLFFVFCFLFFVFCFLFFSKFSFFSFFFRGGADEIKAHPFFKGVEWDKLLQQVSFI